MTYHFADLIDYGSTPTIRTLDGVLLSAESGDQSSVDAMWHALTD